MDRNEYLRLLIGDRVKQLMGNSKEMRNKVGSELHPLLGVRQSTVGTYLSNTLAGLLFPSTAQKGTKEKRAEFLSAFLYSFRVDPKDVAVDAMKELYPSFVYPPPEKHQVRLVDEPARPYTGEYASFGRIDLMYTFQTADWLSKAVTSVNDLERRLEAGCPATETESRMQVIQIELRKAIGPYKKLSPSAQETLRVGLTLKHGCAMMKFRDIDIKYELSKSSYNPFPLMEEIDEMFS